MDNYNKENMPSSGSGSLNNVSPGRTVITLTVIGTLVVLLAFYILYRGERINNREWIAKTAERIDPSDARGYEGVAKLNGTPSGDFIADEISGESFIYVKRHYYVYDKTEKIKTEEITKNGRTQNVTTKYFEYEWVHKNSKTEISEAVRVGKINIRLKEAEIIGDDSYSKTIFISGKVKSENPMKSPGIGDAKVLISGITSKTPIFAVGHLQGNFMGAGRIFIVSSISEAGTTDELHETKWIRAPFCLFLLCAGFILLIHPAKYMLEKNQGYPIFRNLSKLGWGVYVLISVVLSFIIVAYSQFTVDLVWIILACIVVLPILGILRKNRSRG
jgi:hypothetical protein